LSNFLSQGPITFVPSLRSFQWREDLLMLSSILWRKPINYPAASGRGIRRVPIGDLHAVSDIPYRYVMTLMYVLAHTPILRRKRRGIGPQGIQRQAAIAETLPPSVQSPREILALCFSTFHNSACPKYTLSPIMSIDDRHAPRTRHPGMA
jgi:hypothetical protein